MPPTALVVMGDGINCELETQYALELAGFKVVRMHDSKLLEEPGKLLEYQMCVIPGGFSFGDEIASGKVLGVKLKERLNETLHDFIKRGRLLLGICNGFQVLVQMGLLPDSEQNQPRSVSLTRNIQRKFQNRWVKLEVTPDTVNPYFRGLTKIRLPIRHGEGRLMLEPTEPDPEDIHQSSRIMEEHDPAHPLAGSSPNAEAGASTTTSNSENKKSSTGEIATRVKQQAPLRYITDVNGSFDRIAALANAEGNVLGMMPHPEAFVRWTQPPDWTDCKVARHSHGEPDGLMIFKNARQFLDEQQG